MKLRCVGCGCGGSGAPLRRQLAIDAPQLAIDARDLAIDARELGVDGGFLGHKQPGVADPVALLAHSCVRVPARSTELSVQIGKTAPRLAQPEPIFIFDAGGEPSIKHAASLDDRPAEECRWAMNESVRLKDGKVPRPGR